MIFYELSVCCYITDFPYGNMVEWRTEAQNPVNVVLDNLAPLLSHISIVAIVATKEQKMEHEHYIKVGQIKIGKRRVTLLEAKK